MSADYDDFKMPIHLQVPTVTKYSIGTTTGGKSGLAAFPGDPMRPRGDRISDEIRKIEEENDMYTDEFRRIRDLIYAMRATLGMARPEQGMAIKLSTALKELSLEIEKRSDMFGNIDPEIAL